MPPPRRQVNVAIPRNILAGFRRRAKAAWPDEAYGILLGTHSGAQYTVENICYPLGIEDVSTPTRVRFTEEMWAEAEMDARWQGLIVLGDIHTHPYETMELLGECVPAQEDIDRFSEQYLQGIMTVIREGGKTRTRCRFFAPFPSTTTTILR
jgi:proteasome lid subunit RPN8/RPN11